MLCFKANFGFVTRPGRHKTVGESCCRRDQQPTEKSYPTIGPKKELIRNKTSKIVEIMQVNGFAISSPLICFLSKLFICGLRWGGGRFFDRMRSQTNRVPMKANKNSGIMLLVTYGKSGACFYSSFLLLIVSKTVRFWGFSVIYGQNVRIFK